MIGCEVNRVKPKLARLFVPFDIHTCIPQQRFATQGFAIVMAVPVLSPSGS